MEVPMATEEDFPPLKGQVTTSLETGASPTPDPPSPSSPGSRLEQGCGQRSWASLVGGGPPAGSIPEHPLEVEHHDGRFKIFIPQEAYEEMNRPFQWAALARLQGSSPNGSTNFSFVFLELTRIWFCGVNTHPPNKCPKREAHNQGTYSHEAAKGKDFIKVSSSSKGPNVEGRKGLHTSKNQFTALMELDDNNEDPTESSLSTKDAPPPHEHTNRGPAQLPYQAPRVDTTIRRAKGKDIMRVETENQTSMGNPFYRTGNLPTDIPPGSSFTSSPKRNPQTVAKAPVDGQDDVHKADIQAGSFQLLFSAGGITHSRWRGSRLAGHRKSAQDTANRSFADPDPSGPAGKRKRVGPCWVEGSSDIGPPSQTNDIPNSSGEARNSARHDLLLTMHHEAIDCFFIFDTLIHVDRLHPNSGILGSYATLSNSILCDGIVRIFCGWKPQKFSVSVFNMNRYWILLEVTDKQTHVKFLAGGIYLPPQYVERVWALTVLQNILSDFHGPTLLVGDFNAMLVSQDKTGCPPNLNSCSSFNRLDWGLINNVWKDLWGSHTDLRILPRSTSDHSALKVSTRFTPNSASRFFQFRYFQFWARRTQCNYLVQEAWSLRAYGCPMVRVIKKLELTRSRLSNWAKNCVGDISLRIKALKEELDKVQSLELASSISDMNYVKLLCEELQASLEEEDSLWRQRARVKWLAEGDRNTAYYQAIVKGRRTKNSLSALEYDGFPATLGEVKRVVFTMEGNSAPGLDGFPASFYQHHWSIVGHDLLQVINNFLATGKLVKKINRNYIALITKKEGLFKVDDLRPIALCNVLYKIISKFLSFRMKNCLQKVISNGQGAFLPRRSFTENIIFAHECIHSLEGLRQSNICFKIDFSKAYDRVDWVFLKNALINLGFSLPWVDRVMTCVSSASFAVLIDGVPGDFPPMHRGLRQGGPMSFFLFLVVMEELSRNLEYRHWKGSLNPPYIPRVGACPSLLTFALIIFSRGENRSYNEVMLALEALKLSSGLSVNPHKSHAISFGEQRAPLSFISNTDWLQGSLPLTYLGVPLFVGNMHDNLCASLVLKVKKKLLLWSSKLLSYAWRLCLIKYVLLSIIGYWCSAFMLPKSIQHKLEATMANFLWGSQEGRKCVHLVAWKTLCRPVLEGGVGLKLLAD
ncbi:LINE-1 retrotransposable element ORF2 protein [Nymphaea thermarum]|nr:LINE-1 retrotransposable element ORF2 protein [Nymphaea thermarum]